MSVSKKLTYLLSPELNLKAAQVLEAAAKNEELKAGENYLKAANFYRQAGYLEQSLKCLHHLKKLNYKTDDVNYLYAVLSAKNTKHLIRPKGSMPRAFRQIENLLPKHYLEQLFETTSALLPDSEKSTTVKGYLPEVRNSLTIKESLFTTIADQYKQHLTHTLIKETDIFDQTQLDLQNHIELQMNIYFDGGFYLPHIDVSEGVNRKLTCVYYYFREPKAFTGGDLVLFDKTVDETTNHYTRIRAKTNSLVIFESDALHQVTPVNMSRNDQRYARFSLTSWVHTQ